MTVRRGNVADVTSLVVKGPSVALGREESHPTLTFTVMIALITYLLSGRHHSQEVGPLIERRVPMEFPHSTRLDCELGNRDRFRDFERRRVHYLDRPTSKLCNWYLGELVGIGLWSRAEGTCGWLLIIWRRVAGKDVQLLVGNVIKGGNASLKILGDNFLRDMRKPVGQLRRRGESGSSKKRYGERTENVAPLSKVPLSKTRRNSAPWGLSAVAWRLWG